MSDPLPSRPLTLGTPVYLPQALVPFRIDQAVKEDLDAALKSIPPDASGALLMVAGMKGIEAVLAQKVGNHFQVAGRVGKPWGQPTEWSVQVKASW